MRRLTILACVVGTALLSLAVWGCFGLSRHIIVAIDKWGDAGAGVTATLVKVNAPCKAIKGQKLTALDLKDCGTLASFEASLRTFRGTMGVIETVANHEQNQLTVWDQRGQELFGNVNGGVTDLRTAIVQAGDSAERIGDTADAGTRLVNKLRKEVANEEHGVGATLANVNDAVSDVRSTMPDIRRITTAAAGTAEHVEGVAGDGHKVADHYEKVIDNPKKKPLWMRLLPIGAQVAIRAYLDSLLIH